VFKVCGIENKSEFVALIEFVDGWLQVQTDSHPFIWSDILNAKEVLAILQVKVSFGNDTVFCLLEWQFT